MTYSKTTLTESFGLSIQPLHAFVDQPHDHSGTFPLQGDHVFTDFNNMFIDIDGLFLEKDQYDILTVFDENNTLNPYSFHLRVNAYVSHIADLLEVRSSSTFYNKKGSVSTTPVGAKILTDVKIIPLDENESPSGLSHLEGSVLTPISKHMATRVVLDYLNNPSVTSDLTLNANFISEILSSIESGLYNDFYTLRTFSKHDGLYADIMYTYSTMKKVGI